MFKNWQNNWKCCSKKVRISEMWKGESKKDSSLVILFTCIHCTAYWNYCLPSIMWIDNNFCIYMHALWYVYDEYLVFWQPTLLLLPITISDGFRASFFEGKLLKFLKVMRFFLVTHLKFSHHFSFKGRGELLKFCKLMNFLCKKYHFFVFSHWVGLPHFTPLDPPLITIIQVINKLQTSAFLFKVLWKIVEMIPNGFIILSKFLKQGFTMKTCLLF